MVASFYMNLVYGAHSGIKPDIKKKKNFDYFSFSKNLANFGTPRKGILKKSPKMTKL